MRQFGSELKNKSYNDQYQNFSKNYQQSQHKSVFKNIGSNVINSVKSSKNFKIDPFYMYQNDKVDSSKLNYNNQFNKNSFISPQRSLNSKFENCLNLMAPPIFYNYSSMWSNVKNISQSIDKIHKKYNYSFKNENNNTTTENYLVIDENAFPQYLNFISTFIEMDPVSNINL